ncbi:hypothetical protein [Falsiroseomonas selenitidurans]|uniref:Uncharacterized protein n=1 Tax=Falsiroseomonas selenitidurans TaxID=2716335 RepID=A0ABX1E7E2_9PROT|nr:hypothetical protein [Falsiroseomonas selenitidurans]NKC31447.1 hypothetical protein [Falsiroseomonas selenitidurans]
MNLATSWRSAALAALLLGLAWLLWEAAGWLVERFGLPVAALLQQSVLFVLGLGLLDTLAMRILGRHS